MGPSRRTRSNSSVSNSSPNNVNIQQQQPYQPTETPQSHLGMSPAARYYHNLKVLRRRDPSIVSIFDQFSHVCVYHHNGSKWEKQGYEGTMFLYERDSYPPYGFYILNRVGMHDFIQGLYPEDNIGASGNYLMLRSYPDFTARRVAEARHKLPPSKRDGDLSKFAPELGAIDTEKLRTVDKGKSQTVGLWCLATDAREPLNTVMLRIHSYIKSNLVYPDEYRYGPDRPPPPNLHSSTRTNGKTHARSASTISDASGTSISELDEDRRRSSSAASSSYKNGKSENGHESDLDKLFAKLGGLTSSTPSQSTSISLNSLFASVDSTEDNVETKPTPSATPSRGLALLDTLFASATPPPPRNGRDSSASYHNGYASPSLLPSPHKAPMHAKGLSASPLAVHRQTAHIISPTPTTTSVPQILNQEVISSLLGLPPSRASSVATGSSSGSRHSGKDRYEGDNESSDDAEANIELQAAGSSAGIPLLAVPNDDNNHRLPNGNLLGDATPRPAPRGMSSDISAVNELLNACASSNSLQARKDKWPGQRSNASHLKARETSASPSVNATPTMTAASLSPAPSKPTARPLIPFQTDSELWPYPRAPLDDNDIVELDFADTSILSDPNRLSHHSQDKGKKNQKKGKRERAADRERERDEIEKSWDVPTPLHVRPSSRTVLSSPSPDYNRIPNGNGKAKEPHSPPPPVSVEKSRIIDKNAARESLLAILSPQDSKPKLKSLSRNDFIRELLTVIHTDKQFVDSLWHDYTSRYA